MKLLTHFNHFYKLKNQTIMKKLMISLLFLSFTAIYAQDEISELTYADTQNSEVFQEIKNNHPKDWLLPVELYELARNNGDGTFAQEIYGYLENMKHDRPKLGRLIDDGLQLVDKKLVI